MDNNSTAAISKVQPAAAEIKTVLNEEPSVRRRSSRTPRLSSLNIQPISGSNPKSASLTSAYSPRTPVTPTGGNVDRLRSRHKKSQSVAAASPLDICETAQQYSSFPRRGKQSAKDASPEPIIDKDEIDKTAAVNSDTPVVEFLLAESETTPVMEQDVEETEDLPVQEDPQTGLATLEVHTIPFAHKSDPMVQIGESLRVVAKAPQKSSGCFAGKIVVKYIAADNDNLLNSIGYLFLRQTKSAADLRQALITASVAFIQTDNTCTPQLAKQMDKYLYSVFKGSFGGNAELQFFAKYFHAEICVFDLNFNPPKRVTFGTPESTKRAFLLYNKEGFYAPVGLMHESVSEDVDGKKVVSLFKSKNQNISQNIAKIAHDRLNWSIVSYTRPLKKMSFKFEKQELRLIGAAALALAAFTMVIVAILELSKKSMVAF